MTTIEPGTPVRVVIDGIVRRSRPITVDSGGGGMFMGISDDPYVKVTPLDPERPTLDRETIARTWVSAPHPGRPYTDDEWASVNAHEREDCLRNADAVLALIQAAHPEWTP